MQRTFNNKRICCLQFFIGLIHFKNTLYGAKLSLKGKHLPRMALEMARMRVKFSYYHPLLTLDHLLTAAVDGLEGVLPWEAHGKHTEVALQSRVDGEATSGGVHAGHVLHVVDLLEGQLLPVVPVLVVEVLSN